MDTLIWFCGGGCSKAWAVIGTSIMAMGWLIGVMVEMEDELVALRHYFAVGPEDSVKAE